jgi:pimeloyl-ACP methyl ester carboxylesterase
VAFSGSARAGSFPESFRVRNIKTFNQFAAFAQDAVDNKAFAASGKLSMPVLALGGDHSLGIQMADIMREVATDVTGGVIAGAGHWVMQEQEKQTTNAVVNFIAKG